jgi:hypothetical protein
MLGLASLVLATGVEAQDVTWDYAKDTDFTRFKTYAWVEGRVPLDPFNHQRIVGAVDAQLAAKGFTRVEPTENPDALVAYHAGFARNPEITGFGSGWGGYRYGGSWDVRARVNDVFVGTLIVDIVDAASHTIVWRGVASKQIDPHAKPETRDKQVGKAVQKLFRHYPGAS